jgi:predicted nucleic acid-binding Zn ribbon protein
VPTYIYRCNNCGDEKEYQIAIKDVDSVVMSCLICATEYVFGRLALDDILMRRVISVPAVHFRGSGWASKDG